MRILFMTANRNNLIRVNNFTSVERAMSKFAECKWAGYGHEDYRVGESINDTIRRIYGNDSPDWIFIHAYTDFVGEDRWIDYKATKDRDYKIVAIISDLHGNFVARRKGYNGPEGYVRALNETGFDAYLMLYLKLGARISNPNYFLENLEGKILFRPPCINPSIYKPNNKVSLYDVALLGGIQRSIYPLRWDISQRLPLLAMENDWNILIRERPKGASNVRIISEYIKKGYIVGEKYIRTLNRTKVFIFGCSIFKYPLYKYFEGMGCGICVMADTPFTARELHFVPNYNYVEINKYNWVEKLKYYLENNEERKLIARQGYETVMKYHTVNIRAKEVIDFLERNK